MKKITLKEIKEAIDLLNKYPAKIGKNFIAYQGTPYGIVKFFGNKIRGNKKAKIWVKNYFKNL